MLLVRLLLSCLVLLVMFRLLVRCLVRFLSCRWLGCGLGVWFGCWPGFVRLLVVCVVQMFG